LQTLALQERDAQGLADASFLPFEASFERFAPRYAEWVQQRDAEGGRWLEGEAEREVASSELGLTLKGRLDRVDVLPGGERQLIDYKTVPYQTLSKRVREPLEDTQLAFYAALEMLREDEAPPPAIEAAYLALDDSEGIKTVPHAEVEQSARVLLDSLAQELRRMREGAPLPALGEGVVCERCEARGLCRRDHWADPFEGTR
jgi:ATP-dependent helicase/nuclease subunit B